jgi:serine/threonine protein kinase
MGVVYRAYQSSMERSVALKVLSTEFLDDEAFRERFRREGRIAAQLDHPNILPVFEADEVDGQLFIVMRLVDGPTMGDLMSEQGTLRWQRVLEILAPIASALDAAGTAGLVHRDVKPPNILISSGGHPYLADFGLMRTARSSGGMTRGMTRSGEWLGSPDYAAPEHMTDQAYTTAGDIYSLAAVAYHALTGHVAYERMTDLAVLHAHASAPPPKISAWNPELPSELDDVIAWGMAKDARERPASASLLIEELARALRSSEVDAVLVKDGRADTEVGHPNRPRAQHPTTNSVPSAAPPSPARPAAPRHDPENSRALNPGAGDETVAERWAVAPAVNVDAEPDVRRPRIPRPLAALGAVTIVVVSLAVVFTLSDHHASTTARRIERTSFTLRLPSGWKVDTRPTLGTLSLSDNFVAKAPGPITLDAGHLGRPRSGFDPLPAAHEARWATRPQPEHVSLGSIGALRYDATLRSGSSAERTYVVPTTGGYLAMTCRGPERALARLRSACDEVAVTMRARGATAIPPAPSPATARGVAAVMASLRQARETRAPGLTSNSLATRASAAHALAVAHADAARDLAKIAGGPQDRDALRAVRRAVTLLQTDLQSLAAAASDDEQAQYDAERTKIDAGNIALTDALAQLRSAGYRVRE